MREVVTCPSLGKIKGPCDRLCSVPVPSSFCPVLSLESFHPDAAKLIQFRSMRMPHVAPRCRAGGAVQDPRGKKKKIRRKTGFARKERKYSANYLSVRDQTETKVPTLLHLERVVIDTAGDLNSSIKFQSRTLQRQRSPETSLANAQAMM